MTTFKRHLLLISIVALLSPLTAQDLLVPSAGLSPFLDYAKSLEKYLLTYQHDRIYYTFFLCKPSFGPEYSLGVKRDNYSFGQDSLVVTTVASNIWFSQDSKTRTKTRKTDKTIPTERVAIGIPRSYTTAIEQLFEAATITSNHFADSRMGCDGVSYLFSTRSRYAEAWSPEPGSRVWQLTHTADSICKAIKKGDSNLLERQIQSCRKLTKEFRGYYPVSAIKEFVHTTDTTTTYDYYIQTFSNILNVAIVNDSPILKGQHLSDTLTLWARELFTNCYEHVVRICINDTNSTAICVFHRNKYNSTVTITMPSRLFRWEIVSDALRQPFGNYRMDEQQKWLVQKP